MLKFISGQKFSSSRNFWMLIELRVSFLLTSDLMNYSRPNLRSLLSASLKSNEIFFDGKFGKLS